MLSLSLALLLVVLAKTFVCCGCFAGLLGILLGVVGDEGDKGDPFEDSLFLKFKKFIVCRLCLTFLSQAHVTYQTLQVLSLSLSNPSFVSNKVLDHHDRCVRKRILNSRLQFSCFVHLIA
jgi:hypothetical protein